MTQITEEQITAYLLGELPEPEAERVEDAVFNADAGELDAAAVEDDLIEAYLYHELSAERRKRFEDNYLCTEARRDRVAFAAAEKRLVPQPPLCEPVPVKNWFLRLLEAFKVRPLAFRLAVAAMVLVIAAPTIWLVGFRERAPRSFVYATFAFADGTRDGEGKGNQPEPFHFDGSKEAIVATLPLPAYETSGTSYQLQLVDDHSRTNPLKIDRQQGDELIVTIRKSILRPGIYSITLLESKNNGPFVPRAGSYVFTVE